MRFPSLKVNIGEPSLPIQLASTGKPSIVPVGFQMVAGDHDFNVVNLTPSVTLLTEVRPNLDGVNGELPSFYKGGTSRAMYFSDLQYCSDIFECIYVCRNCACISEGLNL